MLRDVGIDEGRAIRWQEAVEGGAVLLGVHAVSVDVEVIERTVAAAAPDDWERASWD